MDCNDSARDRLGPDPSQETVSNPFQLISHKEAGSQFCCIFMFLTIIYTEVYQDRTNEFAYLYKK